MTYTIGNAELTTDHSASSYGIPVLMVDGIAYGPDDKLGEFPAGSHVMTIIGDPAQLPNADIFLSGALRQWASQSPTNGKRWAHWISEVLDAVRNTE